MKKSALLLIDVLMGAGTLLVLIVAAATDLLPFTAFIMMPLGLLVFWAAGFVLRAWIAGLASRPQKQITRTVGVVSGSRVKFS